MALGKLSALKVKNLVEPGRHNDGGGLYLQVRDPEHRSWLFRYKIGGRPRQMGLGPFPDTTLAEAREAALQARKLVREKIDPIDHRRAVHSERVKKAGAHTFRQVADLYIAAHEASWRNAKHRAQWSSTLETYAFPVLGNRLVASIETADVLRVLEPIWRKKPETASRVRGRIEVILDYAKARHWRQGENPARWKGHLAHTLPARAKVAKVEHHAALPWAEIGEFMAELGQQTGISARALEFAILTAARTGEVLGATWAEMDLKAGIWTVPEDRMKAGVEHRVPLSPAAKAILVDMQALFGGEGYVFPGGKTGKPLSNMAFLMLLRRMERGDLTAHGFRSTFRDWAAEKTTFPREVAESALAHTIGNKVEMAYFRSDLFDKRSTMMIEWAEFCARVAPANRSKDAALEEAAAAA